MSLLLLHFTIGCGTHPNFDLLTVFIPAPRPPGRINRPSRVAHLVSPLLRAVAAERGLDCGRIPCRCAAPAVGGLLGARPKTVPTARISITLPSALYGGSVVGLLPNCESVRSFSRAVSGRLRCSAEEHWSGNVGGFPSFSFVAD